MWTRDEFGNMIWDAGEVEYITTGYTTSSTSAAWTTVGAYVDGIHNGIAYYSDLGYYEPPKKKCIFDE